MASFGDEWKKITPYIFIKFENGQLKIKKPEELNSYNFGFNGNLEYEHERKRIYGQVIKTGIRPYDKKFNIIFDDKPETLIQFEIIEYNKNYIIFDGIKVEQDVYADTYHGYSQRQDVSSSPQVRINLLGVPIDENGTPVPSNSNLYACPGNCNDPISIQKPKSNRLWPFGRGGKKHKKHSKKHKKHSKKHKKGKKHTRKHK